MARNNFLPKLLRRKWQPTAAFLPRESCGKRALVAADHRVAELDTNEATSHACVHWRRKWQPTLVTGTPGTPRDRRAWWAAIYGVAESDMTEAT